jgi:hypothetical protein
MVVPWGAAQTATPVIFDKEKNPNLVILTDEVFSCPPGVGRIIDLSDLNNPEVEKGIRDANLQIISSYRLPHIDDAHDFAKGRFVCPQGQQSMHTPWFDYHSPILLYQAWYDQGVRA